MMQDPKLEAVIYATPAPGPLQKHCFLAPKRRESWFVVCLEHAWVWAWKMI